MTKDTIKFNFHVVKFNSITLILNILLMKTFPTKIVAQYDIIYIKTLFTNATVHIYVYFLNYLEFTTECGCDLGIFMFSL